MLAQVLLLFLLPLGNFKIDWQASEFGALFWMNYFSDLDRDLIVEIGQIEIDRISFIKLLY